MCARLADRGWENFGQPGHHQAIDTAVAVGGGTVLVPAGTYLSGSIHLQSNIHLLIDAGATIWARRRA